MHAKHETTVLPASVAHMLRHSAAPAVALGSDGKLLLWNDSLATITRVPAAKRLGQFLSSALAEDHQFGERGNIHGDACASDDPATWVREEKLKFEIAAGAAVEEIVMSFTALVDSDDGLPAAVVGIGHHRAKQQAEQLYSHFLDTANSIIFGVDTDLRINLWNQTATKFLELVAAEAIGETFVETL